MSWQQGQTRNTSTGPMPTRLPQPLAAMMGAVLAATNKPLVEAGLNSLQQKLAEIPSDINWMEFLQGLHTYQTATTPHHRPPLTPVATAGRTTLGAIADIPSTPGAFNPIILVPSLVNRGYIFDLAPGYSLIEHLVAEGFTPWVVDWGTPTPENTFNVDEAIMGHLKPLLEEASHIAEKPLPVLGYCMGGLMAVGAASVTKENTIGKLATVAMPWDFSTIAGARMLTPALPLSKAWLEAQNIIPADILHHMFWLLDPWGPIRRISALGKEPEGPRKDMMVRLEDWLSDGLTLDGGIARDMLLGWMTENTPMRGTWSVGGTPVTPRNLKMPLWVGITQHDNLVPPMCSLPFIAHTHGASIHTIATGHVGLMAGRKSKQEFFTPLTNWLKS